MFVDKQKLERECLDEITKMGNLFDTLKVPYCVFGEYALLAHGIRTKNVPFGVIFSDASMKERILEMIFKMNYTVYAVSQEFIKSKKTSSSGDLELHIYLGNFEGKTFMLNHEEKLMKFSKEIFTSDTKEIWGHFGRGKTGKGHYRAAPLEDVYFSKMNSQDITDITDLETIKGSGKIDMDYLFTLFKKNGLI